jgi:tryptophanyl-tRNA synthetase
LQNLQDVFFLQTNGSGVLSFSSVSSDYVLLATTDITSSTASVSFDGYFSSTYKNYIMYYTNVVPVTDRQKAWIRFRRSNADVTANNYKTGGFGWNGENGALSAETTTSTAIGALQDMSNNGNNAGSGSIILNDPLSTNTKHSFFLNQIDSWDNTNNYFRYIGLTGMLTDNNNALSGLSFYFASGNIARGNFKLYGLK